ncbi:MAG: FKBP-type peptidyl-prolyl cis-trans isomerase [Bacteroidales bacterium]|nr:FKBP-type peptidyl-prolyl cis-trans isomerase [Bacteroidales bacterium]
MKKIILGLASAALVISMASCAGSQKANPNADKALSDSISLLGGESMGYEIAQQWKQFVERQDSADRNKFNKADFMRGFKAAITTDTTNQSFVIGFNVGLNAWNFAQRQNQSIAQVDINTFLKAFEKAFTADSVDQAQASKINSEFQQLNMRIQQIQMKKAQEEKANSPEAIANKNAGEKYINDAKANDAAIQTSETGLSYKVENEGTGDKVQKSDRVKIKYTGKLVDGTEFDKSSDEGITLPASNFVPGFTEGLMLLGKGGKATLYIPADLAYGVDGIPQAGIGPMSTLVFDVEVIDINPAPEK